MSDYIVRAMAADASIRAFAITSKDIVETARKDHDTTPVMTAALGRLLSVGAMMGAMMKGDKDLLTLQIQCSGPAKGMTVTADSHGNVKGFALNPQVDLPLNSQGKLDVGGALDLGILSVIKDMGLKEPYVGQCQLQTGEIAEDLTYYFATSEQVPSSVGLGVLMNKDNTVKQAGGFIIQGAMEEVLCRGLVLQSLKEKTSLPIAIAVSTLMFILPHSLSLFSGEIIYSVIGVINLILISIIFLSVFLSIYYT